MPSFAENLAFLTQALTADASKNLTAANTPAVGDNSKKLATTEFVRNEFAAAGQQSLTTPGYQKLPGGLILQWGTASSISIDGNALITLPIAFPNAALGGSATINAGGTTAAGNYSAYISFTSNSQIRVHMDANVSSGAVAQNVAWFVIGY